MEWSACLIQLGRASYSSFFGFAQSDIKINANKVCYKRCIIWIDTSEVDY